jgi:hypothetical protein
MTTRTRRVLATVVALSLSYAGMVQAAAVGVSPASQLIGAEQVTQQTAGRALLEQALQRADVVSALQARGVNVEAARARVASLTDEEALHVAAQIDSAPSGGDALGTIVFIFVLLLITDILGFTKIFPFTRPIR